MKYIQLLKKKVIERTEGVPYLIRWNLFGIGEDSKWFSVKIHNILVSDDECLHDHPWWFVSIILKGSYKEYRYCTEYEYLQVARNNGLYKYDDKVGKYTIGYHYKAGNVLIRPANWAHRLEVVKPIYTLVFTFKKIRLWGFFTAKGWKKWYEYNKHTDC